ARNVLEEAKRAGVRRVVHTSTVGAIGGSSGPGHLLNEDDFGKGTGVDVPYPQTKYRAEKIALEFAAGGLDVVIASPTFFVGPDDVNLSSARTIVSFLRRQVWVGLTRGGMGVTDVRDVARGLLLAMERGKTGRRYILGGHNVLLPEYHALLSRLSGVAAPRLRLPPAAASVLARVGAAGYRAFGIEPFVGPGDVRMARNYWLYDYRRAREELGLTCRPLDVTLSETLQWLYEAGYARRRPTAG
ncbi:MAG: NAD-dependent epimerase/dehydratase family protein, partial [Planctomycetia bacterium]